jgi:proteasome lid subunit RPN8/RPN11
MGSETASEFGVWTADGQPWTVEYSLAVLDDIRVAVVDGLHRLSRGGLEVGGVLFGDRSGSRVRILAQRPMACEHSRGPCFVLSEKDLAELPQALAPLDNLQPVGWYHSHTRAGIQLDDADIDLFNRHFPLPWQCALVLHPEKFGPVTAGFFFREAHGQLPAAASPREFEVASLGKRERPTGAEPPAEPAPPALESMVLPPRPGRSQIPIRSLAPVGSGRDGLADARLGEFLKKVQPARSRRRRRLLVAALCLVAFLAGLASWNFFFQSGEENLALHAWDERSQLRIVWDRASRPVQKADRAAVDIDDGGTRTELSLDREHLRNGSLNYVRHSSDVAVRLTVYRAGSVLACVTTRFLGPPPVGRSKAESEAEEREALRLAVEAEDARRELDRQAARTKRLERQLQDLKKRTAR